MKKSTFVTAMSGAVAALLLTSVPGIAEPDRGKGMRDGGPAAKVERRNFDGDRSSRRGLNKDVQVERRGDGPPNQRWNRRRDRDFVVRQGRRHNWGGITFYLSDGYYYGECGWLKRRAVRTGNPIWWSRFRRCRDWS